MVDPKEKNDNNQELIEALKTEEDEIEQTQTTNIIGFSLKKILFFVIIITILLIITLWLSSLASSNKNSNVYSKYETKMVEAAKHYYKVNNKMLPGNNESSEVTLDKLIELKYMEDYSAIKSCTGSVTVENIEGSYEYVSYLDCGDKYNTKILLKQIKSDNNIVTSDSGLYKINNEYVFRGEKVNNYVKFSDRVWRVVKIDSNNDIVLVLNEYFHFTRGWDDRYNNDLQYESGYNIYEKSRMKEFLDDVYKASVEGNANKYGELLVSKKNANKLVGFKACVGKMDLNQTLTNNTYECSKVINNTKIALLTLSDYVTASIDSSCTSAAAHSCQNYNYLKTQDHTWWLITANPSNSYEAYWVNTSGNIESIRTSSYADVRPVIHLRSNVTYSSGKGTESKPYVIK